MMKEQYKARNDDGSTLADNCKKRKFNDIKGPNKLLNEFNRKGSKGLKNRKKLSNRNSVYSSEFKIDKAKRTTSIALNHYEDSTVNTTKKFKLGKQDLFNSVLELDDEEPAQFSALNKEHKRIPNLTPEQDERIKQIYKEQKKAIGSRPILELKESGEDARINLTEETRYPIFFPDIEDLLSHVQNNLISPREREINLLLWRQCLTS